MSTAPNRAPEARFTVPAFGLTDVTSGAVVAVGAGPAVAVPVTTVTVPVAVAVLQSVTFTFLKTASLPSLHQPASSWVQYMPSSPDLSGAGSPAAITLQSPPSYQEHFEPSGPWHWTVPPSTWVPMLRTRTEFPLSLHERTQVHEPLTAQSGAFAVGLARAVAAAAHQPLTYWLQMTPVSLAGVGSLGAKLEHLSSRYHEQAVVLGPWH